MNPAVPHLGVVELVDVCAQERARCLSLFVRTGEWVTTTADPTLQRLFATASHRHAWHAELWADRAPTIPVESHVDAAHAHEAADDVGRVETYRRCLAELLADLAALRARIDPDLDPSTIRVIDLVVADADDLADRLDRRR